jgi:DMSO/TMAO reductase YedYZ heme-binding membrane subunit
MASDRKAKNTWVLAVVGLVVAGFAAGLQAMSPPASALTLAIRTLALVGYQLVFLSIVSSAYTMELVRFFGRPFIRVHHIASVTGLVLITLHPILVAVNSRSAGVFLPRFDSLSVFLQLGGRPAWFLIALAVTAAFLRQKIGGKWRWLHVLNYLAFALATAHANLLGANFQALAPRVVSWTMLFAILAVFVRKRLPKRKPAQVRRAP